MENKETFSYTYSAKQQEEIKNIRNKYLQKSEDKMEQLRRLDRNVTSKATAISLVAGIIGALILSVGICCCLIWTKLFVLGIIVGIIGTGGVLLAYPVFVYVTKKERERIAPEIIRLTDELMK